MQKNNILVTGSSGFIGFHVCKYFLEKNIKVIGIDNHNNYYDEKLKKKRCAKLLKFKNFLFRKTDIRKINEVQNIFSKYKPKIIIHLAAQPGVRYSFINPQAYIDTNITGFVNILESMKKIKLNKLIYASSSSVYGNCNKYPFKEDLILEPLNFYGQTKLMNEKIANIFQKNFGIKAVGLRFFTVYGPFGRPDMFIPKIIKSIKNNSYVNLYNRGNHVRDFTYVEDVSDIVFKVYREILKNKKINEIYNVCGGSKVSLKDLINLIQKFTKKKIKIKLKPFQRGDMFKTHGSKMRLKKIIKKKKFLGFKKGIKKTLEIDYFKVD